MPLKKKQLFKTGDKVTFKKTGAGTVLRYKDGKVVVCLHEGIKCLDKKLRRGVCFCQFKSMNFYEKELTLYNGEMKMDTSSSPDTQPTHTGKPDGAVTPAWYPLSEQDKKDLEGERENGGARSPSWPGTPDEE